MKAKRKTRHSPAPIFNLDDFRPPRGAIVSASGTPAQIIRFPYVKKCCRPFVSLSAGDAVFNKYLGGAVTIRGTRYDNGHIELIVGDYLFKAHYFKRVA
jgi:hypothetical protein